MTALSESERQGARRPSRLIPFVIVAFLCLAFGAWAHAVLQTARERANRRQCPNTLKAIGSALHSYHEAYGTFPPPCTVDANGKRLHSWRTLILPHFHGAENERFGSLELDKPWNEGRNRELGKQIPYWGRAVGRGPYKCWKDTHDRLSTSYMAVIGPETAWGRSDPLCLGDLSDSSTTILIIEKANSGIHWMEPRDVTIKELPTLSRHEGGVYVLFANGMADFMPADELNEQSVEAVFLDKPESSDMEARGDGSQ